MLPQWRWVVWATTLPGFRQTARQLRKERFCSVQRTATKVGRTEFALLSSCRDGQLPSCRSNSLNVPWPSFCVVSITRQPPPLCSMSKRETSPVGWNCVAPLHRISCPACWPWQAKSHHRIYSCPRRRSGDRGRTVHEYCAPCLRQWNISDRLPVVSRQRPCRCSQVTRLDALIARSPCGHCDRSRSSGHSRLV